jgi:hypothetical protein
MLTFLAILGGLSLILTGITTAAHKLGYPVPVLTAVAQWIARVDADLEQAK